ncbi:MAG: hypothetical protein ACI8W7_004359 [Gammaproteobacteria bacterium]|jgi:hypothetical protein
MTVSHQSVSRQSNTDTAGTLLMVVGSGVLLLGALMLASLALVVIEVINNPNDVALVNLVMQSMQQRGVAVAGHLGEFEFSLTIDEPLRTLLFLVVCVWLLGALASILKTVVMTGKALVERGRGQSND